jgi:tetratricopeptide (TPR) repeat protein
VEEYVAELLGAEGRYDEAAAIYERIVAEVPKPELQQALGELYALMDDPERARMWNGKALAAYLQSAGRGQVHYYHHLVDFYSDVTLDGTNAVEWARRDVALRENFSTQAALAWALYREGRFAEALEWIDRALGSGAVEPRLFHQAAKIYEAAGRPDSARLLQRATGLNPHVECFHVHH